MRRTTTCPSCRQFQKKLERKFRWNLRLKALVLIVLSKLLSFLILIFTCYRERF